MSKSDTLRESASQTAGPYLHIGLTPDVVGLKGVYKKDLGSDATENVTYKVPVKVRVFDGNNQPVTDVLVEIWYASPGGTYGDNASGGEPEGWARGVCTPGEDHCRFHIIKPGSVSADEAPHLNLWIAARGINMALNTRMYFPEENNENDPVLALVEPERRKTLIASKTDEGYTFEIHLQGENETVFFDV